VWIYKGEVLPDGTIRPEPRAARPPQDGPRTEFRDRRNDRRTGTGAPRAPRPVVGGATPGLVVPTAGEIEDDHQSLASEIDGAPSAAMLEAQHAHAAPVAEAPVAEAPVAEAAPEVVPESAPPAGDEAS
jgi:hypothetical protein